MELIARMTRRLEGESSPFRAQLLREDIARLDRLRAMAGEHDTLEAFEQAGLYIGWTRDDMRTHELKEPLRALLAAIWAYARAPDAAGETAILDAWADFNRERMEKLIHCL